MSEAANVAVARCCGEAWFQQKGPEFWTVTTLPARFRLVPKTPTHALYILPVGSHATVKFMTKLERCYVVPRGWGLTCVLRSADGNHEILQTGPSTEEEKHCSLDIIIIFWIYFSRSFRINADYKYSMCVSTSNPQLSIYYTEFITLTCRIVCFVCKPKLFILSSHASCDDLRCCPKLQPFQSL